MCTVMHRTLKKKIQSALTLSRNNRTLKKNHLRKQFKRYMYKNKNIFLKDITSHKDTITDN